MLYFQIGFNAAYLLTPTFPKWSVTIRELIVMTTKLLK